MTGIQALERIAPDKPVRPDHIARHEFEYERHGTTTLIGNFDVVTGDMIASTLGPTRTEEDFINHIERTVNLDPNGNWVFIMDTLNPLADDNGTFCLVGSYRLANDSLLRGH